MLLPDQPDSRGLWNDFVPAAHADVEVDADASEIGDVELADVENGAGGIFGREIFRIVRLDNYIDRGRREREVRRSEEVFFFTK